MRRSFFPASLSLLLCSALLSGCVVTNDYIAFDSKAAPSPQIKRYDGNEWASERRHGSGREDQQLADGHFCRQRRDCQKSDECRSADLPRPRIY